MKFYDELVWRGLIKDSTSPELEELLNKGGMKFYIGADPTAESLHIGQFPTFLMIERLKRAGHIPYILVGGATGRVGDPRGTGEREKADVEVIDKNFVKIKEQMTKLFGSDVTIVNNYDWFKDMNYIDFLRDVGKYINVSYMINKDLVKRQLDIGISYAEFSYMLIQGYDFLKLNELYGINLQFGGSDQWGNLTTGIELIRKLKDKEVYAFSMPLTTDKEGNKLGKSYGNALWLDKTKTSSYELYQYILNFEDVMMEEYLKRFTFLNKEEIESIMNKHLENPEKRIAQKTLAKEVITFLHGESEFDKAVKISECLFSGEINKLSIDEIKDGLKDVPNFDFTINNTILNILVDNKIAVSKREAREFLSSGSITVNGEKIIDENKIIDKNILLEDNYLIIRKGKKKYFIGTLK